MTKKQLMRLDIAKRILPGLLASGHYSQPADERGKTIAFFQKDNGKDYQEFAPRRFTAVAIDEALALTDELLQEIEYSDV